MLDIVRTSGGGTIPITVDDLRNLEKSREDIRIEVTIGRPALKADALLYRLGLTEPSLFLLHGELSTKDVNEEVINWMLGLAQALDARVRDDEYRTYRTAEETYIHPDDAELQRNAVEVGQQLVQTLARRQRLSKWVYVVVLASLFLYWFGKRFIA